VTNCSNHLCTSGTLWQVPRSIFSCTWSSVVAHGRGSLEHCKSHVEVCTRYVSVVYGGHLGHDSVIYSRSERPADSVHLHAPSVPANLGRRVLRAYGPTHAQSVWASLTFKVCGPRVTFQMHWPMGFHISTWVV